MSGPTSTPRVAIAGNPNTGKTTLFNRLTGLSARVGNYPGVTVEREAGRVTLPHRGEIELLDVPGTYSLTARSAEEQIAISSICGLPPQPEADAVLIVVDATQLTRNLYLVLQVIETGVPVLVALNMVDMLPARGVRVHVAALAKELGVPVVSMSARDGEGVEELKQALDALLAAPASGSPGPRWVPSSEALRADVAAVAAMLPSEWRTTDPRRRDAFALWALLSLDARDEIRGIPPGLRAAVIERRERAQAAGRDLELEVVSGRYGWIDHRAPRFVLQEAPRQRSLTDSVDRVLLHPTLGFGIFVVVMAVIFQSLFSGTEPVVGWITSGMGWLKQVVVGAMPPGLLADFVGDAVIEGLGSVLVFLPQIMLLFFFIGVMEDTGYMARVAMLMDRVMKAIGLHGRAFVPMMSGFACAVPAVLATRTMERKRDRFLTMMVIPLMTCSARLPVYALIIAALFPPTKLWGAIPVQGLLMVGMYLLSTVTTLTAAAVLGRTVFKGHRVPLLLEMPPYRKPHWNSVAAMMWKKSRVFLTEAGTVILACTAVMWALLSFPRSEEATRRFEEEKARVEQTVPAGTEREAQLAALVNARQATALTESFGGKIGRALEPLIAPLGFDWKIGIGLLGAFVAREVFVSTMGVVYGMGKGVDEGSPGLRDRLRAESAPGGAPKYTPLMGFSLMTFFALACQCMSTLAVVRRETRSVKWPAFLFGYTFALAWLAAFVVYQGGRWLGLGGVL